MKEKKREWENDERKSTDKETLRVKEKMKEVLGNN